MIFSDFAREFAARKHLGRKAVLRVETWPLTKREHLYAEDPAIIARFISEIKQLAYKKLKAKVYLRGQAKDYTLVVPSLFRSAADASTRCRLLQAHDDFCNRLPKLHRLGRFQRPKLAALLQHYWIKTPWLDLVDNLFVAAWFGTHIPDETNSGWQLSQQQFGWIYVVATGDLNGSKLDVCDLREEHHPLSVRLHTQHAISACMPDRGHDFSNYVAARIRFPVNTSWTSAGGLLSSSFLFPNRVVDHTLKKLCEQRVTQLLEEIEKSYALVAGALGRVR